MEYTGGSPNADHLCVLVHGVSLTGFSSALFPLTGMSYVGIDVIR
jgi:hypothetical protein